MKTQTQNVDAEYESDIEEIGKPKIQSNNWQ